MEEENARRTRRMAERKRRMASKVHLRLPCRSFSRFCRQDLRSATVDGRRSRLTTHLRGVRSSAFVRTRTRPLATLCAFSASNEASRRRSVRMPWVKATPTRGRI